jgi:chromosome segregation ATPase
LARIDDLNKLIDSKTYDLKNKEAQLVDCEGEIIQLKNQVVSFQNELNHLKSLEEKYRHENTDLQKRIDSESSRNIELTAAIKDLESKIRAKEDQIMYMRKELEGARYSNSALLDNNSNLQVEIDSLNNHIRVITIQNEELTKELDEFVQANEAIRQRLDRKARVQEIRQRNEQQINYSVNNVHDSRSPIGKRNGERSPLRQQRV